MFLTTRRLIGVALMCAVAAVAGLAPAGAQTADPDSVITVSGGGWGHGVGLCQYGAAGRARAGQGYAEILAHYYDGAQLVRLASAS